jgi:molybdopterin synthase sulfur carrier subunit
MVWVVAIAFGMIRVAIPFHLRTLARVEGEGPGGGEVALDLNGRDAVTTRAVLDALEAKYPMLRGTIRDHVSGVRRPFIRFFACGRDLSHESPDSPLPEAIARGDEPFLVIGAIAGG